MRRRLGTLFRAGYDPGGVARSTTDGVNRIASIVEKCSFEVLSSMCSADGLHCTDSGARASFAQTALGRSTSMSEPQLRPGPLSQPI